MKAFTSTCLSASITLLSFLACIQVAHLAHNVKLESKPENPNGCYFKYVYGKDPMDRNPYTSYTCYIVNHTKGDKLPFLNIPRIVMLDLGWLPIYPDPEIEDGTFDEMLSLTHLNITGCFKHHLTSKLFGGLHGLDTLSINLLRPGCIPTFESDWLHPLKGLRSLNISFSNVISFSANTFCGLNHLKSLDLRENMLNSTEGLGLQCNENVVPEPICSSCLPNVTYLDLSDNELPILKVNLSKDMPKLKVLLINNSSLSELTGLDGAALTGLIQLELSNNNLSSFIVKDVEKCNGSNLAILRLQNNLIQYITPGLFSYTEHLKEFNLSGNSLSVETLMETGVNLLTKLKRLDLSDSNIPKLQLEMIQNMTDLMELLCRRCKMKHLEKDIFIHLTNLSQLDLSGNNLVEFESMSGIPSLIHLDLKSNSLLQFPDFSGSWTNLRNIDLSRNGISELKPKLFEGLISLENLNIASNNITYIFDYLFTGLSNLKSLDLSNNGINVIEQYSFFMLPYLTTLKLELNMIKNITFPWFSTTLKSIDMHGNQMTELGNSSRSLAVCTERLDLSCNQITHVALGWFFSSHLKFVNLTYNRLHYVSEYALWVLPGQATTVLLEGNFLHCDCNNQFLKLTNSDITYKDHGRNKLRRHGIEHTAEGQDLLQGMHGFQFVKIADVDSIYCDTPFPHKNHSMIQLSDEDFLCPYTVKYFNNTCDCCHLENSVCDCCLMCYNMCTCYKNLEFNRFLMDCSSRNIPVVPPYLQMLAQEIYLDNNGIEKVQKESFYFDRTPSLQKLYLHNNRINLIEQGSFKYLFYLKTLWLHTNKLTSIDLTVFDTLVSLEDLTLHDNPWECDCTLGPTFKKFVLEKLNSISNASAITCAPPNATATSVNFYHENTKSTSDKIRQELLEIDFSVCNETILREIKHIEKHSPVGLASMALTVVFTACLVFVLYKNKLLLKVWAFNYCGVRCHHEVDDNIEKPYDVFLAYAKEDEKFVVANMLPPLESKEMPYRVCLEGRDWRAGEFITDNIIESVHQSKRTILLVSENYFESPWCQYEFQAAHYQVLKDRQMRLILVLMDISLKARMESDMKLYLKTGVYLVYGEKYFWQKLRYYLADGPRGANDVNGHWIMLDINRNQPRDKIV